MDNIKNAPDGQEQIKSKLHKITDDIRQIFLEYDLTYSEIKSLLSRIEAELSPENHLSRVSLYLNNVKYKELITMPYGNNNTHVSASGLMTKADNPTSELNSVEMRVEQLEKAIQTLMRKDEQTTSEDAPKSVDKSMYNAKASQQNVINSTGTSASTEAQLQNIQMRIIELGNTVDFWVKRMKLLENSWHTHEKTTNYTHPIHHDDV